LTVIATVCKLRSDFGKELAMRAVDLFAGCGGLSLGLQRAGFDVVAGFEIWHSAANVYRANFVHEVHEIDLSNVSKAISVISDYRPDLIAGGPPCQDFSQAGLRREGDRASLTDDFARIIAEVKPRWFLMENVERALTSSAFQRARRVLLNAGYGLTVRVLDASRCGAPQLRKRMFCIGQLSGHDDGVGRLLDSNLRSTPMTVREYFGESIDTEFYYRHPRNYSRRGVYSIDEPAPTMRGMNRPIPKGYPGHPGDAVPVSGAVRPLTTTERSRIQTFPSDFRWLGSKTEVEQMIGNAVPVALGTYVGAAILKADRMRSHELEPTTLWAMPHEAVA
jgi:DNA (cytosine-5)-methyltransferase 1